MNKIISTLTLLSFSAFATALSAQTYDLTASALYLNFDADGVIKSNSSVDAELDDGPGFSLEWKSAPIDGLSFGLEYLYMGTDASIGGNITAGDATSLNTLLGTTFVAGATVAKEDYTAHSGLINATYFIPTSEALSFYLGAGIGISFLNQELSISNPGVTYSGDSSDEVFIYQVKAGLHLELNEAWAVNGGVRYIGFTDPEFSYPSASFSGSLAAFAFEGGISYSF